MVQLIFIAEENCMSSTIAGSIDAFSIANMWWRMLQQGAEEDLFTSFIVTADGQTVTANGDLVLTPHGSIHNCPKPHIIIVPAMFFPYQIQASRLSNLTNWMEAEHKNGALIATSCTGAFLLAETGLLNNRTATTNWQMAGYFKKKYPAVKLKIERILTESDGIYCTGAATAFMNLCLHFIEKFGSAELYARCAKSLLVDPDRTSQAPYMLYDFWKNHGDDKILEIQKWLETHFSDKITIDGIADKAGISPRHFKRRFKSATGETPINYLQLLRIENAKRSLENTSDNLNDITWQVGYEDINSFRKLFKKFTGLSPKEYRNKFSRINQL